MLYHGMIDLLIEKNDTTALAAIHAALKKDNGREIAHRILNESDDALRLKNLSGSDVRILTEANLARLGLRTVSTKGDGNCFFHAVGDQLGVPQNIVRKEVADSMSLILSQPSNLGIPNGLGGARPTTLQRDNTLLDASSEGTKAWGEDIHCAYVARAFDRPVVLIGHGRIAVYEKDQETRIISSATEVPGNAIFLSHKGGNHWEAAKPLP